MKSLTACAPYTYSAVASLIGTWIEILKLFKGRHRNKGGTDAKVIFI
ncbi:hypothetical protein [Bacillus cereus]|nr:hypothetical protein [Bacillus cereus]